MKNLSKLFRKKQKIQINDPVFGLLENEQYKNKISIWSQIDIEQNGFFVSIEAPLTGPSQSQREFYIKLKPTITEREIECKKFIRLQPDAPDNIENLSIYSIFIGPDEELNKGQFTIELADDDAFEINYVEYVNWHPQIYGASD